MEDSAEFVSTEKLVRSTKHLEHISYYTTSRQYNNPFDGIDSPKLASLALRISVSRLKRIPTLFIRPAVKYILEQRGVNDFADWQSWYKALQGPLRTVALLSKLKLCYKVLF
jgi:hypothetical protein